ncbi:hypothetical protein [Streptomyces pristinaespiralis]|uniref:hypothetical protein n=1 Tax=Streptomyces pristinaespiralis TaxID=38300 RepID=UPI0033D870A2
MSRQALAHAAAVAPLMHNAQPWLFLYFQHTMSHSGPDTRGLHIGCGAALLNRQLSPARRDRLTRR